MFNIKPAYPIAVDIGNENISMAQLKDTREGLAVRGCGYKQFDDGIPVEVDAMVPVLKKMLKDGEFVGKSAVVQIPPKEISSFPISFEVGQAESMESVIVRESQEYIPFPVNEASIDYLSSVLPVDGEGKHYKATVIAVHRDQIKQYLRMLKQAGLSVEIIDFGLLSLVRLHRYLFNTIIDPVILCYIDRTQSLLSVVSNDSILAQRYVQWGIDPVLEKLEANLSLSNDKKVAVNLLKTYGLTYDDRETDNSDSSQGTPIDSRSRATYQITVPYINGLIYEFQKMIGYVRSGEQNTIIKSIYIYGQGALIRNMDQFFERRLNLPTSLINPLEKISFSGKDRGVLPAAYEDLPISLALGLAMRKVSWL